jgi:hypothetical protein
VQFISLGGSILSAIQHNAEKMNKKYEFLIVEDADNLDLPLRVVISDEDKRLDTCNRFKSHTPKTAVIEDYAQDLMIAAARLLIAVPSNKNEVSDYLDDIECQASDLRDLLDGNKTIDETIDNHEVDKPTKNEIDNRAFVQVKCADDLIELLNEFKEQMQSSNFSRNNRMSLFNCLVDEFAREFWVLHIRSKEIYPEYFIEPERDHLKRYN